MLNNLSCWNATLDRKVSYHIAQKKGEREFPFIRGVRTEVELLHVFILYQKNSGPCGADFRFLDRSC